MPVIPNIPKTTSSTTTKKCEKCGSIQPLSHFSKAHNEFYVDGFLPWCDDCITERLDAAGWDWDYVDRLCMWAGIPFIPKEWERIKEMTTK